MRTNLESSIKKAVKYDGGKSLSGKKKYLPDQVLVLFKDGVSETRRREILSKAGILKTLFRTGPEKKKNIYLFRLRPGVSVVEAVQSLEKFPEVALAEPNYVRMPAYTPNDPDFSKQWALKNVGQYGGIPGADIDAENAWDIERGLSTTVTVAVIDSGIDLSHPEFVNKLWRNPSEVPGNFLDDDGNGYIDDVNGYNFAGISQLWWNAEWWLGDSLGTAFAQSIKGTGQKLTHIGIMVAKHGNPTNPIKVSVRSRLDGPDIAFYQVSPDEIPTFYPDEIYKPLNKEVLLENGKTYYIVVDAGANSASDFYVITDNSKVQSGYYGDAFLDGYEYVKDSATPWQAFPDDDLYFRTNPNAYPRDDSGHGSHVSGIIAAQGDNNYGIAGVSFGAMIMPLKASGGPLFESASIIDAIYYAADNGAKIINLSFGGGDYSALEQQAISYAFEKGISIFAAAGNDSASTPFYPAAYEHVIAVSSTNNRDERSWFSNYGSYVDVSAPGQYIYSTVPTYSGKSFDFYSGTSMASPMAAGVAALIYSLDPTIPPGEVESVLEKTADDLGAQGWDQYFGSGRINAYRALLSISDAIPPKIEISGVEYGYFYKNPVTIYVSFFDENLEATSITLNGTPFVSGTTVSDEGSYTLVAIARDKAGNESSKTVTFVIDMTPPQITISGVVEGTTYTTLSPLYFP